MQLKEFEKGIRYVKQFHKIWEKLHGEGVQLQGQEHSNMNRARVDAKRQEVDMWGLHLAVKGRNFEVAEEILHLIPWENENSMEYYYTELEKWKKSFASEKEEILKCLSNMSEDSCYLLLQKALYAEEQQRIPDLKNLLKQCQEAYAPEHMRMSSQIVRLSLQNEADITILLKKIPLEYWREYAVMIAKDTSHRNLKAEFDRIKQILKDYPLHCSVFEQSFIERQMMLGWTEGAELVKLVEEYCGIVMNYYQKFLKERLFCRRKLCDASDKMCVCYICAEGIGKSEK